MLRNRLLLAIIIHMALGVSTLAQSVSSRDTWKSLAEAGQIDRIAEAIRSKSVDKPEYISLPTEKALADREYQVIVKALTTAARDAVARSTSEDQYGENLKVIYNYFVQHDGYASILLCDGIKRSMLQWSQNVVIKFPNDLARCDKAVEALKSTDLAKAPLRSLFGPKADPSWFVGQQIPESLWKTAVEKCAISYGYKSTKDVPNTDWMESYSFSQLNTKILPIHLLRRTIFTETLRRVHLEGTVGFLHSGGKADKVDVQDVVYFQQHMPLVDRRKYAFPAVGYNEINVGTVAMFLLRYPSVGEIKPGTIAVFD